MKRQTFIPFAPSLANQAWVQQPIEVQAPRHGCSKRSPFVARRQKTSLAYQAVELEELEKGQLERFGMLMIVRGDVGIAFFNLVEHHPKQILVPKFLRCFPRVVKCLRTSLNHKQYSIGQVCKNACIVDR